MCPQIIALLDIEPPPATGFKDVYLISELMETDLHRVIYSRQKLSPEHVQYFLYQVCAAPAPAACLLAPTAP